MNFSATRGCTNVGNCANGAPALNIKKYLGSKMQGWWDAADFNTMFTTIAGSVRAIDVLVLFQAVGRWEDKSGNAHHLLALADNSTRGVLAWDGGGGYGGSTPGPPGSGKPQVFTLGANSRVMKAMFALNQPAELFVVGKTVTADGFGGNGFIDGGAGLNTMRVYVDGGSPANLDAFAGSHFITSDARVDAATAYANSTGRLQFRCLFNGASSIWRYNNGVPTSGNVGAGNPGGIQIGSNGVGYSTMSFNEIILTNAACSAAERATIESYFRAKWGVA